MDCKRVYRADVLKLFGDINLQRTIENVMVCKHCVACKHKCSTRIQSAIIDYIKVMLFTPEFEETELKEYHTVSHLVKRDVKRKPNE